MAKASYAKEDMYTPALRGFVERVGSRRLGEVTAACVRYVQWQPSKATGSQVEPLCEAVLEIAEIDKNGQHLSEPVSQELVIEWGPKDGSVIRVRPGIADSAEDGEPDDTLSQDGTMILGTEGNTIWVEDGVKLNITNPWGIFAVSCQEKGFKPQVLGQGYLPDFVGMRAWFDLRPGREYTNKAGAQVKTEDFVVAEIVRFPYETKAPAKTAPQTKPKAAVASAGPAPASAAPKANGAPQAQTVAPGPTTASSGDRNGEAEKWALACLTEAAQDYAKGPDAERPVTRQKLTILALQRALDPKRTEKPAKSIHGAIQGLLKDENWFLEHSVEFGAVATGENEYQIVT